MDPSLLAKPLKALRSARAALERIQASPNFDSAEHEWRSFLNFIDQVLSKLGRAYKDVGGSVGPWIGREIAVVRSDPLLNYLAQARNADQHSLEDPIAFKPGKYEFKIPGGPGPVLIEHLKTGPDGRVVSYRGSHKPEVHEQPPTIEVAPVVNRGVRYDPPTMHKGGEVTTKDPLTIGRMALFHYEDLLRRFEETFLRA